MNEQRKSQTGTIPSLEILQPINQDIKVNGVRRVKIEFVLESFLGLLRSQDLVERVLNSISLRVRYDPA